MDENTEESDEKTEELDEKTEELRDLFLDVAEEETVTERQEETPDR
ncbi:hypothetical protein [Halalkalicoccus salilacus]